MSYSGSDFTDESGSEFTDDSYDGSSDSSYYDVDVSFEDPEEDETPAQKTMRIKKIDVRRKIMPTWQRILFFASTVWVSFISWSNMYGFLWSLFWHQVDPTDQGVSFLVPTIFFSAMMAAPLAMESKDVLKWVDNRLDYLTIVQVVVFTFALIPATWARTVFTAIGALVAYCYIPVMYSRPDTDLQQQAFRHAHPAGLFLLMVFRWNQASINPFYNSNPAGVVITVGLTGCTAAAIIVVTRRITFAKVQSAMNTNEDLDYEKESKFENKWLSRNLSMWWFLPGVSLASLLFLTIWLFTTTAVVSRWNEYNPYPNGIAVLVLMLAGTFLNYIFVRLIERSQDGDSNLELVVPLYQLVFTFVSFIVGGGMLMHIEGPAGFFGGCLMVFALPTMWFQVCHDFVYLRPSRAVGRSVAVGAVWFFFLAFMFVGTLVGGDSIFFGRLQGQPYILFWTVVCTVVVSPWTHLLRLHKRWLPWRHVRPMTLRRYISWRLMLPTLSFVTILFFVPWLVIRPLNFNKDSPKDDGVFDVASVNLLRGYQRNGLINVDNMLTFVQDNDIDFVGVQESDALYPSYGNRDLVGYLSYYLNMHEYYGLNPKKMTYGAAFLSRYELSATSARILPSQGRTECTICPLVNRVVVQSQVTINSTTITILNTQIDRESADVRELQLAYLVERFNAAPCPAILMGDFRYPPEQLTTLYEGFNASHSTCGANATVQNAVETYHTNLTHPEPLPPRMVNGSYVFDTYPRTEVIDNEHVDYIWFKGESLILHSFSIMEGDDDISQHLPLLARFKLNTQCSRDEFRHGCP